jgi:hypothetical protein
MRVAKQGKMYSEANKRNDKLFPEDIFSIRYVITRFIDRFGEICQV